MVRITPQSGSNSPLAGEINLHGRMVPVYQVRTLLGFPNRNPHLSDVLIVTKTSSGCVALWVDETSGISPDTSLTSPLSGEPVLHGVTITAEGLVIIRELAGFLANPNPEQIRKALHTRKEIPAEDTREVGEDRVTAILAERAQKLSQPAMRSKGIVRIEVLKFRLAYQEFAISMKYVREVVLTGGITPVPGTPEYISGICAIRGEIISLVDLRVLFSLSGRGLTDLNRVIVVTDGTMTFGILADYITGIATIPASVPAEPTQIPPEGTVPYLLGVVEGIVILDGAALLSDPHMLINETAA
jgi:purine-binding chemotaxis protein CheW